MGTTYYNLEIINRSASSCTLVGTPVAQAGFNSYATPSFVAVGAPAGKLTYAGRGHTILLRPRRVASVEFGVGASVNYPQAKCAPRTASEVVITFTVGGLNTLLEYSLQKFGVCTKLVNTSIFGVVLGTHFP